KLKKKGWTDIEISYYEECKEGLYYTDIYLHEGTIKILLQKFLSILDNFNLNVSAREIINRIIIEKFQIQLSNIVINIRTRYSEYLMNHTNNTNDYSQYYPSFKYEPLDYIDKLRFPFQSPVMEIVKKMMSAYLNLLEPSKRNIIKILRDTRKNFENSSTYEIDEGDINKEGIKMSSRCLI
ncbi:MAG TPA: hypothetical protein VIS28_06315, partial [Nitrososphaeraceae archaeon]